MFKEYSKRLITLDLGILRMKELAEVVGELVLEIHSILLAKAVGRRRCSNVVGRHDCDCGRRCGTARGGWSAWHCPTRLWWNDARRHDGNQNGDGCSLNV